MDVEDRGGRDHETGTSPEDRRIDRQRTKGKAGKTDRAKGEGRPAGPGQGHSQSQSQGRDGNAGGGRREAYNTAVAQQDVGGAATSVQLLDGDALLSILKANPPGITRYSRTELLSIGRLPASKVKPRSLNSIIDKENTSSPLLIRPKAGKEDRDAPPEADLVGGCRRDRMGCFGSKLLGKDEWRFIASNTADRMQTSEIGSKDKGGEPQWDMPDANSGMQGDLANFTLGDIRQAERSMNSGMSMKDYKASLRSRGLCDANDPFQASGDAGATIFVEEEDDAKEEFATSASRGFGKWFGSRADDASACLSNVTPRTSGSMAHSKAQLVTASAGAGVSAKQPPAMIAKAQSAIPMPSGDIDVRKSESSTSNVAGRSILSMLGRRSEASGGALASTGQSGPSALARDKHGKVSVAELFNLAQGKEMPPIPMMTSSAGRVDSAADALAADARHLELDASKTASPWSTWATAAAQAHLGDVHGAARYHGYNSNQLPCGAVPPIAGRGQFGVTGQGYGTYEQQHALEAYSQSWASQLGVGYPPYHGHVVASGSAAAAAAAATAAVGYVAGASQRTYPSYTPSASSPVVTTMVPSGRSAAPQPSAASLSGTSGTLPVSSSPVSEAAAVASAGALPAGESGNSGEEDAGCSQN
mmetsp:Transcript_6942/g.17226  ORF Transcript_6942/g.17226 Transcript_6942/m.17226 type:complete len:646 (-) Transcript_6942:145-2082(-)